MKNSTLFTVLRWGIAAAFITPLIVAPSSYIFPFVVPKVIFFRILMTLLLVVFAMWVMANWKEKRIAFAASPVMWVVVAFIGAMFASMMVSVDVTRSLWDNHERMLGSYTIAHYVALFFIARQVFTTWKQWQWLLSWVVISAAGVFAIGYFQMIEPTYLINQGSLRVRSTLGNTIYVSGYAMFTTIVAVVLAWYAKARWAKYTWLGFGLFSLGMVLVTRTRGTWLGLAIASLAVIIALLLSSRVAPRVRKAAGAVLAIGVIVVGLAFGFKDSSFVQGSDLLRRATDVQLTEGTARTRIMAWQVGIEAWQDNKLLGWGPNTFFYAFNQYYNPEFLRFGLSETWFDSAHNVVINTLTTQGVVGVAAYLALFIAMWIATQKMIERDEDLWVLAWGIRFFIVAHFIHNLFVFENTTSYLYFFTVLALVDSLGYGKQEEFSGFARMPKATQIIASALIVIVAGVGVVRYNLLPRKANQQGLEVMRSFMHKDVAGALTHYADAKETYTPHQEDIVREVTKDFISWVNFRNESLARQYAGTYPIIIDDIERIVEEQPMRIRSVMLASNAHQQVALMTNDSQSLDTAIKFMKDARELSPQRQQVLYDLGQLYLLKEDQEAGVEALQAAIDAYPGIPESHVRLGIFYAGMEEREKSIDVLTKTFDQFGEDVDQVRGDILQLAITKLIEFGEVELANKYQGLAIE